VQGQVAVYVGPNVDAFREAFASFGAVVIFAGESNAR
jgi:hypothetical protein